MTFAIQDLTVSARLVVGSARKDSDLVMAVDSAVSAAGQCRVRL